MDDPFLQNSVIATVIGSALVGVEDLGTAVPGERVFEGLDTELRTERVRQPPRQHQSLGYRTPRQAYEAECPWICGRSASPTGCAFAHIPTGATANHRIDIDEEERSSAMTVAPGAIGAGTEIGRATP